MRAVKVKKRKEENTATQEMVKLQYSEWSSCGLDKTNEGGSGHRRASKLSYQ